MDLIILKNVNVGDIRALGLLSFLESELSMSGQGAPPSRDLDPIPQAVPIYQETKAPSDVEPPKQMEIEALKKGRGRPKNDKPVMTDVKETLPEPTPEPTTEPTTCEPEAVTEEQIRELCKTAIKSGIKHEVVVQTFQQFAPDATLIAQVPQEHWPALAAKLREVTNASQ